MPQSFYKLRTMDELRQYVHETLCQVEQLASDAFGMSEQLLLRDGRPCGVYFCLHGPRSVILSAIWETDRNTILFYGGNGERFTKTRLVEAPCLELAVA